MLSMNQRRTFLCTLLAACLSLAPGIRPAFAAGTPTATPSPDAGAPPVAGNGPEAAAFIAIAEHVGAWLDREKADVADPR